MKKGARPASRVEAALVMENSASVRWLSQSSLRPVVLGQPRREAPHLAARHRRRPLDDGLNLARVHPAPTRPRRKAVAKDAQLLPPELALIALGEELPVANDLEHLGNV